MVKDILLVPVGHGDPAGRHAGHELCPRHWNEEGGVRQNAPALMYKSVFVGLVLPVCEFRFCGTGVPGIEAFSFERFHSHTADAYDNLRQSFFKVLYILRTDSVGRQ